MSRDEVYLRHILDAIRCIESYIEGGRDETAAEQSFRKALAVAQDQEAVSLELRAATSLARLLRDSNRAAEGQTMLSRIYDDFEQGFDSADLREAKALLDQL